ncbi:MAG: hypothetical protein K2M20_12645 [Lachnospiraceae bacterium]|nr:hypothetical protein [Lachnospiraceae bacterium]
MRKKFRKHPTKKHISFRFLSLLLLSAMIGLPTACGQGAVPGEAPTRAVTKELRTPLPSEDHIRAFTVVQDLKSETFIPATAQDIPRNSFSDLSVPTYVTKVEDTYFIVDCYHNQVIYHDNLTDPLTDWQVLTGEIDRGHTVASDGSVYLVDDTEGNRILVFEKKEGVFYHTQTLDEAGNRPHYIVYDAPTDTFYVWSSMNGEMYLCRHDPGDPQMYLTKIRAVEALKETYVRSFTIDGNDIYFVSGIPGTPAVLQADLSTFAVQKTYPVPDEMAGMIQLTFAEGSCYLTVSTDITGSQDHATIIRTKNLKNLAAGKYEDIYENFIGGGTPYYITQIDNAYYLTEHRIPGHAVWKFDITKDGVSGVEAVY